MTRQPYYESDNPDTVIRGATWRGGVWVGAVVAIVAVIGAITWGVSVLTAEPKGRGDAYKQKESANNRIFAQERFEKLHAEYETTLTRIDQAFAVRETSAEAEVRFQGLQSYCTSVVADYNAAARSYRLQDFKAYDLPEKLDPATCTKEILP